MFLSAPTTAALTAAAGIVAFAPGPHWAPVVGGTAPGTPTEPPLPRPLAVLVEGLMHREFGDGASVGRLPLGARQLSADEGASEGAIVGPNRIVERPMFVPDGIGGERIEKRKLMNISISCDHRVVDGWDAASFVQEVKRLLETPVLLLAD